MQRHDLNLVSLAVALAIGSAACSTRPASAPSATPGSLPPAESVPPSLVPAASLSATMSADELFAEEATAGELGLTEVKRETRDSAVIRDVRFAGADGKDVAAYVVGPAKGPSRGGVLFLHWLGPENSGRREFLDEAVALTAHGLVSVLVQQTFPWGAAPSGVDHDRVAIGYQVRNLRRAITLLVDLVGPAKLAVVGHDFGAMYAVDLAAVDERPAAVVLMAPTATWADWFVPHFHVVDVATEADYRHGMNDVDPLTLLARGSSAAVLWQFASADPFVPKTTADELAAAGGEHGDVRTYDAGHALDDAARAERVTWLLTKVGAGS